MDRDRGRIWGRRVVFCALAPVCFSAIVASIATAGPFTEEATLADLDYSTAYRNIFGYGAAFVDLDNDGDPDAVITSVARIPKAFRVLYPNVDRVEQSTIVQDRESASKARYIT